MKRKSVSDVATTEQLPTWLSARVQTAHVSPAMRMAFEHLPTPIQLELTITKGGPLPSAAAALVKAALVLPGITLKRVHSLDAGQLEVRLQTPHAEVRLLAEQLVSELDEVLEGVLGELLPQREMGQLMRKLGLVGSMAATLHTITTHMLGTFDLDKALYVMLSGITAGYCLGFNRAVIFRHDPERGRLVGHLAIGPADEEEAHDIWEGIEANISSIEELIANYERRRLDGRLLTLVKQIDLPLSDAPEEVARALATDRPVHFRDADLGNSHMAGLGTNGEFVLSAIRAHHRLLGVVFADDYYQRRPIDPIRLTQLGYFTDLTALIWENLELLEQQRELARRDPLTGVFNRREFDRLLAEAISWALVNSEGLTLMLLDIDHFKDINDRRGHSEGDRILRGVARAIQSVVRDEDLVARYGGDEFILALKGAQPMAATAVGQRIQTRIRDRLDIEVSIGCAYLPKDKTTAAELFEIADTRLYEDKNSRNHP